MRGVTLLPGRDERLACERFFVTIILLKKLRAEGVILPQLGDVAPVQGGGDLVAAKKAGDGADRNHT